MKRHLRFLITAGPTREFIDPVRFISNRSSGKMGYALAEAARKISPCVTLISGPTCLKLPRGVKAVSVVTAAEMAKEVFARFPRTDVVVMAAAVSDFCPRKRARLKIKKAAGIPKIDLVPTVDILGALGRRKRRQLIVGFAAETDNVETNARQKLRAKRLDMIVANDVTKVGEGFETDTNRVVLFFASGRVESTARLPKRSIARLVIHRCIELLSEK